MKIQPIQNTQNFKGLFIDCSKENGGDWKMVYRPYSWEHGMDKKQRIDITSNYLPDNEEIYTPIKGEEPAISKDILGTVSYYKYPSTYNLGETRRHIIVGEPLSREESLNVYMQKLDKFKEMKTAELERIANENIQPADNKLNKINSTFNSHSDNYDETIFSHKSYKKKMCEANSDMRKTAHQLYEDAMNYIKINSSIANIELQKQEMNAELELIKQARNAGKLIDISKRNVSDPNKPYWEAVINATKNEKTIITNGEIVVFPHATKSLKSLIEGWFKAYGSPVRLYEGVSKRLAQELMFGADYTISRYKRF